MTRKETIQLFVLDTIADDYENLAQINSEARALGARCGIKVSDAEVLESLTGLIAAGLACAYRISINAEQVVGLPREDEMSGLYYWISEQGKCVHAASAAWPFQEDGRVLDGWYPPAR